MDMAETLPNTPAVSYGVKTVKHLARATKARPGPSPMYQQSKDGIREYFLANVDPLVADCVTHLLFQKPDDVVGTLIGYLTLRKELGAEAIAQPPTAPAATGKPKASHKVFLATQISPVLSYVMNKIAHARPVEVSLPLPFPSLPFPSLPFPSLSFPSLSFPSFSLHCLCCTALLALLARHCALCTVHCALYFVTTAPQHNALQIPLLWVYTPHLHQSQS
jgi:hypothetical protein